MQVTSISLGVSLALLPSLALAHISPSDAEGVSGGLQAGLLHPVLGYDHLLAMLAVGIWGAQMGGRAVWILPVVFPLVMAVGGALGVSGVELPQVEGAIALSVLILGLAILVAWRAPEWIAGVLVGTFAVFHGYAHGTELPELADPLAYSVGFVVATGTIHVVGIAIGLGLLKAAGGWIARGIGGVIAAAGVWFVLK